MPFIDARVPLRFGTRDQISGDEAALIEGEAFDAGLAGHAPGCACCAERSGAGRALAALFERRARGEVTFFQRVVAVTTSEAGRQAVVDAVRADPVASSRFRLG